MTYLERVTHMPCTQKELFEFFTQSKSILRRPPKGVSIKIIRAPEKLKLNDDVELFVQYGPFKFPWHLKVVSIMDGLYVRNEQVSGKFKYWDHQKGFENSDAGVDLREAISYQYKAGFFGNLLNRLVIRPLLKKWLAERHRWLQTNIMKKEGR